MSARKPDTREKETRNRGMLGRLEPVCLVLWDIAATYVSVFASAWGTQSWASLPAGPEALLSVGILAAVNVVVFALFHMYNSLWRYASITDALRIALATAVGALLGGLAFLALPVGNLTPVECLVAWAVLLVLCAGVRFAIRAVVGSQVWRYGFHPEARAPRTLVVGAGETGSLTIKRMLRGDIDVPGDPVAVVDDDPDKQGGRINGVKVCGSCADIPRIAKECGATQIVLAVPSATATERRRILDECMLTGLKVLTMPNVRDIPLDGEGRLPIRDVEISDLLSRDEVVLDLGLTGYVHDKCVLVTGGGGSIGSELVRQLLPAKPARIVLFDIYENTTYELYHEIREKATAQGTDLRVVIGSIVDVPAITAVFDEWHPSVVFHAAAHKHVPLMEACAREAVQNNVMGTRNVARLAHQRGCSHFILVSTDKAVNPTNVMGATKRMCEMVVHYYSQVSPTVFAAVRFGNVLGSHGSVIPLFKRQLREGGPITLTHPDITRYFMTIPEASRLVIAAGALAKGGETFILKMGEPVRIYDLAVNLIRLSGLKLGRDVEIEITGLRPGEKLFEELQMEDEEPVPTDNDDIMVSTAAPIGKEEVASKLALLEASLDKGNDEIKRALSQAVPTYKPQFESK